MDNVVTLSVYLTKMGWHTWHIFTEKRTMINAKYLPGALNKATDFQSRNLKDSKEWKLNPI